MRVEVARLLNQEARLLLDEPTNHLDPRYALGASSASSGPWPTREKAWWPCSTTSTWRASSRTGCFS